VKPGDVLEFWPDGGSPELNSRLRGPGRRVMLALVVSRHEGGRAAGWNTLMLFDSMTDREFTGLVAWPEDYLLEAWRPFTP
jgi:hypothetical protein